MWDKPLIQVDKLTVDYPNVLVDIVELDGIRLNIHEGQRLGIVGESGSGKTTLLKALLGLVEHRALAAWDATVLGQDLRSAATPRQAQRLQRPLLGRRISSVFQAPKAALNPYTNVISQVEEVLNLHHRDRLKTRQARTHEAKRLLEMASLNEQQAWYKRPGELSGGQCQRAMLALVFACNPTIILADEPTTGLDVSVQRQLIYVLEKTCRRDGPPGLSWLSEHEQAHRSSTLVVVSHDLGLMNQLADRVVVMHKGQIVEDCPRYFKSTHVAGQPNNVLLIDDSRYQPYHHPYTRALLESYRQYAANEAAFEGSPGKDRADAARWTAALNAHMHTAGQSADRSRLMAFLYCLLISGRDAVGKLGDAVFGADDEAKQCACAVFNAAIRRYAPLKWRIKDAVSRIWRGIAQRMGRANASAHLDRASSLWDTARKWWYVHHEPLVARYVSEYSAIAAPGSNWTIGCRFLCNCTHYLDAACRGDPMAVHCEQERPPATAIPYMGDLDVRHTPHQVYCHFVAAQLAAAMSGAAESAKT